jgi:hypothetical protein
MVVVVVAIDYFTKLAEFEPLTIIISDVVQRYCQNSIICGFRMTESLRRLIWTREPNLSGLIY